MKLASRLLENTKVKVCTVIGFPLGSSTSLVKALEVRDAVANGATEVDMVINVGALKSGDVKSVARDIAAVVEAAGDVALTKVIMRLALDEKEKIACLRQSMLDTFVKTSTDSVLAALREDVALMRKVVGSEWGQSIRRYTRSADR